MRGRRSEDNLFSLTVGGALAFCRHHCVGIWSEIMDGGVWGRGSGEERENGKRVLGRKKEFVFGLQRDFVLNTQVINAGTKGGNRLAIRKGMKLMKQRLCFKITANLGNSKGQHCSRHIYIYIYIYVCMYVQGRDHCSKSPQRKRKWKGRKGEEVFYSHMFRGLNVKGHFGSLSGKKKPRTQTEKSLANR